MTNDHNAVMHHDLETGDSSAAQDGADGGDWAGDDDFSDPFDIANTKNASHESLKRWRVRISRTKLWIPN